MSDWTKWKWTRGKPYICKDCDLRYWDVLELVIHLNHCPYERSLYADIPQDRCRDVSHPVMLATPPDPGRMDVLEIRIQSQLWKDKQRALGNDSRMGTNHWVPHGGL